MAYNFTAASSQYLTIGTSSSLAFGKDDIFTVAGWFYIPSVGVPTGFYPLVNKQQNSGNGTGWSVNYFHNFNVGTPGIGNFLGFQKRFSGGDQAWASITFTATNGSWFHAAFSSTSASTSDMKIYANGVQGTNQITSNNLISSITNSVIPQINGRNGANNLNSFQSAEVGIWNAALTASEVASLAKGMTCDKVRPQSLVFYAPLVRDLQDQKGGLTITNNNGATVANHPRVYA
jgi:hypothetical protein